MKKLLLRVLFLALFVPFSTMAEVRAGVSIFLPPLIGFDQPPELIVLPETHVYVIPDIIDEEIFFYDGWWWRLWEKNWYRSRNYNSVWDSYEYVPSFYSSIASNWRNDYKVYNWKGHQWIHQRISYKLVEQNWNIWKQEGYWEKRSWNVRGLELTSMKWKSDSGIIISAPSPIIFASPPQLVVIPETNIYVVPGVAADIFFYSGWWWRLSDGSWYRSRRYYSGWVDYPSIPSFYREIPTDWRYDYRAERWRGQKWKPELIPHDQVQGSWSRWEKTNHWENERTWGVKNMESVRRLKYQSIDAQKGTQLKQDSIDARQQQSH
ncbi:MAG: hypothetical protein HQK67_07960 [Desulfamplus sp.]|nr:hypothetical protein [Desulfamplus sp.]